MNSIQETLKIAEGLILGSIEKEFRRGELPIDTRWCVEVMDQDQLAARISLGEKGQRAIYVKLTTK